MNRCLQLTGFLTRLPCGEPALLVCTSCGKFICAKHQRSGSQGITCPDCAVSASDSSRDRSSSSSDHFSDYSNSDYSGFDQTAGGGGEMGGGGASGDWISGDEAGDSSADDSGGDGAGAFQDS